MISPSQRPLPDNTQHSQQTNIHAPGGIRTHNLSRRAARDLRLRPRGHWDRHIRFYICYSFLCPLRKYCSSRTVNYCVVCGRENLFRVHSYFCACVRRRMCSIVCGSASVSCWNKHLSTVMHSFIAQSVLRQIHNLLQSEFSTDCYVVLPLNF